MLKWDVRWLCLPLALTVLAGAWTGRRQPAFLRLLLWLALVLPAWQEIQRWGERGAVRAEAPGRHEKEASAEGDASMIRALVAGEETTLRLNPKMSALSKDLLNLRLPGPATEAFFAPAVTVSDIGPEPAVASPGAATVPPPLAKCIFFTVKTSVLASASAGKETSGSFRNRVR